MYKVKHFAFVDLIWSTKLNAEALLIFQLMHIFKEKQNFTILVSSVYKSNQEKTNLHT